MVIEIRMMVAYVEGKLNSKMHKEIRKICAFPTKKLHIDKEKMKAKIKSWVHAEISNSNLMI